MDLPYLIKKIMGAEIQVTQRFSFAIADASDVHHGFFTYVLSSSDAWPCCLLSTQDMQTPASAANAHSNVTRFVLFPHLARLFPEYARN